MTRERKSFLERLTGSVNLKEERSIDNNTGSGIYESISEESGDAELAVDLFQTNDAIILKAFIAGVHPDDLDVNITRDMVTVSGTRKPDKIPNDDNSFVRELYWGSFSRTVTLPTEVDVEESEAVQKYGLLTITMPKLDRKKQVKIKIKSAE